MTLGRKIQTIRLEKNQSLRRIAAMAGITPSMLSQIENDLVNPSINTLRAVAQALDTPLYHLFKEEIAEDPVVHPHTRLVIGSAGEPDVQYQLLTRDTKGSIEFCMMVIPPHKSSCRDMNSHAGEEVAYICGGEAVELDMDGKLLTLRIGDSLRIPGNMPHVWHNHTDVDVQVIFAITPPTF